MQYYSMLGSELSSTDKKIAEFRAIIKANLESHPRWVGPGQYGYQPDGKSNHYIAAKFFRDYVGNLSKNISAIRGSGKEFTEGEKLTAHDIMCESMALYDIVKREIKADSENQEIVENLQNVIADSREVIAAPESEEAGPIPSTPPPVNAPSDDPSTESVDGKTLLAIGLGAMVAYMALKN